MLASSASAAPVTWNIVSSASSVKLAIANQVITVTSSTPITLGISSFTVSVRALNPGTASSTNNPGLTGTNSTGWNSGNRENVNGTLLTDFDPGLGTIQFLNTPGTNLINGIDSGSYAPLPDGSPGTAPGDFGARIFANTTLLLFFPGSTNVDIALRDVLYNMASGVLPIGGGGSVNTTGVAFGTENGSAIAYRARDGGGTLGPTLTSAIPPGASTLPPLAGVNTAAGGSVINTGGNNYQLTVPISIPISIPLDDTGLLVFKATITGTMVATATVPEPATFAMLGLGMAALAPVAVRRLRKRA